MSRMMIKKITTNKNRIKKMVKMLKYRRDQENRTIKTKGVLSTP